MAWALTFTFRQLVVVVVEVVLVVVVVVVVVQKNVGARCRACGNAIGLARGLSMPLVRV